VTQPRRREPALDDPIERGDEVRDPPAAQPLRRGRKAVAHVANAFSVQLRMLDQDVATRFHDRAMLAAQLRQEVRTHVHAGNIAARAHSAKRRYGVLQSIPTPNTSAALESSAGGGASVTPVLVMLPLTSIVTCAFTGTAEFGGQTCAKSTTTR